MLTSCFLVVHSDADIADLVKLILADRGYPVEATNDFVGLFGQLKRRPQEERPSLILLEVRAALPCSFRLLDRLRADPDLRAIPILVLATLRRDGMLARARSNVLGTIELPFEIDDLYDAVESASNLARPPALPPTTGRTAAAAGA